MIYIFCLTKSLIHITVIIITFAGTCATLQNVTLYGYTNLNNWVTTPEQIELRTWKCWFKTINRSLKNYEWETSRFWDQDKSSLAWRNYNNGYYI